MLKVSFYLFELVPRNQDRTIEESRSYTRLPNSFDSNACNARRDYDGALRSERSISEEPSRKIALRRELREEGDSRSSICAPA